MTVTKAELHAMDRAECLALLAEECVGRLAVTDGRTPMIVPVNYGLDGEDIIFRTDPGAKYELGPRARACFEIDQVDRRAHIGWSVLATGWLEEVTHYDAARWARLEQLHVEPWAAGTKLHRMRLVTERITGRRLGP